MNRRFSDGRMIRPIVTFTAPRTVGEIIRAVSKTTANATKPPITHSIVSRSVYMYRTGKVAEDR